MQPGLNPTPGPGFLVLMDPPDHTRLRRLLTGTFTSRQIAAWRPRVRERAVEVLDARPDRFDFVKDVAFVYPAMVLCDVLGIPAVDFDRIRTWMGTMLSTSGFGLEQQVATFQEFLAYLAELVIARQDSPGDGLLATMIEARDNGDKLTADELVGIMFTLVTAGHEATGVVLSRSLLWLLDPRERFEALRARPESVPATVDELLRLESPQHQGALIRVATEDVPLPSGLIRKGEGVVAAVTSANHDPEAFPNPTEMILNRRTQHVTFARGIHHCLGANLARLELQVMLEVLIERHPNLDLAVPADDVPWNGNHMFEQVTSLPLHK
ncbi:cytochrome P450 [Virgisporangium aliadipatigenens]|uniref:Cytochrome P450 n=2 Tax=Virgisporangium aliadipatigenens TaxID=741659 RepID=A0A8J3YEX6_9ACTN|nr:cytochrome P450 [Virgisporangium aliadipatigenens]